MVNANPSLFIDFLPMVGFRVEYRWVMVMQLPLPSAQEGAGGQEIAVAPKPAPGAFISGPDAALWVGFGAFLTIFLIVILLIIRGRVIAPARRKAMDATFFEPAGQDAEISFDDLAAYEGAEEHSARKRRKKRREQEIEEPLEFSGRNETGDEPDDESSFHAEATPAPAPKKRTAFSGLFAKKAPKAEQGDLGDAAEEASQEIMAGDPAAAEAEKGEGAIGVAVHEQRHAEELEDEQQRRDEFLELERRRLAEQEANQEAERERAEFERVEAEREEAKRLAAEEAERAHAAAEERDRIYREARDQAERDAEFERRKAEAALEQRMQSVAAMQRKLAEKTDTLKSDAETVQHQLDASLEERFAALSKELNSQLENAAKTMHAAPAGKAADPRASRELTAELADFFSREIKSLRDATEDALALMADKIDKLNIAPEGASELAQQIAALNALLAERTVPSAAGRIQLVDIVRNALPADRYAFSHKLQSGRTADCLIFAADRAEKAIAIDARYPVEAFDDYVRAGMAASDKAKNAYRRTILRHIAAVAEALIVPGETENFAVMFAPSEAIFNDLHANFADIIQDSYRARVWILSPTSLMATLHMMSAVASGAQRDNTGEGGDGALLSEIADLRQRLKNLEEEVSREHRPAEFDEIEQEPASPSLFDVPQPVSGPDAEFTDEPEAGPAPQEEAPFKPGEAKENTTGEAPYENAVAEDEPTAPDPAVSDRPPFPLR